VCQSSTMMLLQELLSYQDKFGCHYTAGLQGSGPSLEADIRSSYYTLIQRLIHACRSGSVHPAAASRSISLGSLILLSVYSKCYEVISCYLL